MLKKILKILYRTDNLLECRKEIFCEYTPYLNSGNYKLDSTSTYFYLGRLSDKVLVPFRKGYRNQRKHTFKKRLSLLVSILIKRLKYMKYYKVKGSTNKVFNGDLLFIANDHIKIFDFSNKIILLKYSKNNEFTTKLDSYNQFSDFFVLPQIFEVDDNNLFLVEEYISDEKAHDFTDKDLLTIFDKLYRGYLIYFNTQVSLVNYNCIQIDDLIMQLENTSEIENIKAIMDKELDIELRKTKFPYVMQHGDLWTSNILYNKNEIVLIDWEKYDSYVFFYDLIGFFGVIFNNSLNYYLMKEYKYGRFDKELTELFKLFNLEFNKNNKLDLIYLVIINLAIRREIDSVKLKLYINRIKSVFDNL